MPTPDSDTPDPAAVAARLTRPERDIIRVMSGSRFKTELKILRHAKLVMWPPNGPNFVQLCEIPQSYTRWLGHVKLNALGLAVKAHLESQRS